MKFADNVGLKGNFELYVYKRGALIEHYEEHNMIMDLARDALARLIGGDGDAKVITHIGIGTNGDGPDVTDTALTDQYKRPVSGVTYPTTGQACFEFTIGTAEANGMAIREFGLLCDDGSLFARKTRGVIEKEEDIEISGTWTIKF